MQSASALREAAERHLQRKEYARAVELLRRAMRHAPADADMFVMLGVALRDNMQLDEALAALDGAIALRPALAMAHFNRGHVLHRMNRATEALEAFDAALAQKPSYLMAWVVKGQLLADLGRHGEALACYERAESIQPGHPKTQLAKSELLLRQGDYANGWELFEVRWRTPARMQSPSVPGIPLWNGQPLAGRTILIHPEVGIGDFVMFARYVPLLQDRGAKVLLLPPPGLGSLLAASFPRARIIDAATSVQADFQCPVMSLPRGFRTTIETVPASFPYLRVPEAKQREWHARLGERTRPRVGVMWSRGRPRRIDRSPLANRSLALERIAPWTRLPVEFHSLQKELLPADAQSIAALPGIRDHRQSLEDFGDTGALIEQMDLVISIDTSVAHVAGALGKPLWTMLPLASDYRWPADGSASAWYPSARMFRQRTPGDWAGVVAEIGAQLAAL